MKLDKTELGWAAARNVCKEAGADLPLVTFYDDDDVVDEDEDDDDEDEDGYGEIGDYDDIDDNVGRLQGMFARRLPIGSGSENLTRADLALVNFD